MISNKDEIETSADREAAKFIRNNHAGSCRDKMAAFSRRLCVAERVNSVLKHELFVAEESLRELDTIPRGLDMSKKITLYCQGCGGLPEPIESMSTKGWEVIPPKCPKCGGNWTVRAGK